MEETAEASVSCTGCFLGCGCFLMSIAFCIFSFGLVVEAVKFVL